MQKYFSQLIISPTIQKQTCQKNRNPKWAETIINVLLVHILVFVIHLLVLFFIMGLHLSAHCEYTCTHKLE